MQVGGVIEKVGGIIVKFSANEIVSFVISSQ